MMASRALPAGVKNFDFRSHMQKTFSCIQINLNEENESIERVIGLLVRVHYLRFLRPDVKLSLNLSNDSCPP